MATVKATLIAIALALCLPVLAQGEVPAFCHAQDPGDPDWNIADYDPVRDSDDWCKLAYHEPHKAKRQLSKAVALVRAANNPNRYYFRPDLFIQFLRPWMAEQNAAGTADWRVFQNTDRSARSYWVVIVDAFNEQRQYWVRLAIFESPRFIDGKLILPYTSEVGSCPLRDWNDERPDELVAELHQALDSLENGDCQL